MSMQPPTSAFRCRAIGWTHAARALPLVASVCLATPLVAQSDAVGRIFRQLHLGFEAQLLQMADTLSEYRPWQSTGSSSRSVETRIREDPR